MNTHLTFLDFGPGGQHTWNTLFNLVVAFESRSNSFLAAAMASDVELYESTLDEDGNPPEGREFRPPLSEVGVAENILMKIYEELQVVSHRAGQLKGVPKVTPFPRPKTARDYHHEREVKLAEQDLLSMIVDG